MTACKRRSIILAFRALTDRSPPGLLGNKDPGRDQVLVDRFIRDDDHYANTFNYIERNPVYACLVSKAEYRMEQRLAASSLIAWSAGVPPALAGLGRAQK